MSGGGERLRAARKRHNLTQKDLAKKVGCSQQTIVDIEGQENPHSRFLTKVVRELGESLEWIESGLGCPAGDAYDESTLPHFDLETAGLRALDSRLIDQQIDSLYAAPIKVSRMAFTVGVDRMTAQVMEKTVNADDVIFVDPGQETHPGSYGLFVMPGWERAELRQREYSNGKTFIGCDSDRFGPALIECHLYRSSEEYLQHQDADLLPALCIGAVVFIGRDI